LPENILIKNTTVITMNEDNNILVDTDILIENNRIKKFARGLSPEVEDTQVINGKNKVTMPGLINMHNHAAMSLLRSYADDYPLNEWLNEKIFPVERHITYEDVYWGTMLSLLEMISGGTTTFVDMYFFKEATERACQESGIRAILSAVFLGENKVDGFCDLQDARQLALSPVIKQEVLVKTILGPHALYTCPPDFLTRLLEVTAGSDIPIHIHVAETENEVQESLAKYKKTPVALMNSLGVFDRQVIAAHCVHLTNEDIDILVEKNVGIAHNPGSNLKLGSGVAPLSRLLSQGAKVGLGTDGAASNNNLDMFEEIRLSGLLQKGIHHDPTLIDANTALNLATAGGARALRIEGLGIIREGALADIILLDFDKPHLQPDDNPVSNIVYSASAADVDTVIINGVLLYSGGEFYTLDRERIFFEIKTRAARLRK